MITDRYTEAEIQALIALAELQDPMETPNNNAYTFYPQTLPQAQTYFRTLAVDLSEAFCALHAQGLACYQVDGWQLTPAGLGVARSARLCRPPIYYWYNEFYAAIETSQAFAEYTKQVFGLDLGQHGFCDLEQLEQALAWLRVNADSHLLDIGCGNGKMAEYISDRTGAHVTGIDYVALAIEQALARTAAKRPRLDFAVMHIDELSFPTERFDAILSIDTIFFAADLSATMAICRDMLKPGGRMACFCGEDLRPAMTASGLTCSREDLNEAHYVHLQRKHRVAASLRDAFQLEGNGYIWDNLMAESVASDAPYDPSFPHKRYLYQAIKSGLAE